MLVKKKETYKKFRFYPHPYLFFFFSFFSIPPPKRKREFPASPSLSSLGPSFNDAYKTRIAVCTECTAGNGCTLFISLSPSYVTGETCTVRRKSVDSEPRLPSSSFLLHPLLLIPRFSNPRSTQHKCKLLRIR